jgi:hypothetical protein
MRYLVGDRWGTEPLPTLEEWISELGGHAVLTNAHAAQLHDDLERTAQSGQSLPPDHEVTRRALWLILGRDVAVTLTSADQP